MESFLISNKEETVRFLKKTGVSNCFSCWDMTFLSFLIQNELTIIACSSFCTWHGKTNEWITFLVFNPCLNEFLSVWLLVWFDSSDREEGRVSHTFQGFPQYWAEFNICATVTMCGSPCKHYVWISMQSLPCMDLYGTDAVRLFSSIYT